MCVCRGEVILKWDEEEKIKKDRGVHLVDWAWGRRGCVGEIYGWRGGLKRVINSEERRERERERDVQ